jgi:5-methylcytosine-specific restriction protein A
MRNPKWHHDELIITLDLYHRINKSNIQSKNPEIIKHSEILNKLSIHSSENRYENFRNPNGVALKLSNFASIDPNYNGKGMRSYSKLDKEIFLKYYGKSNLLTIECEKIYKSIYLETINKTINVGIIEEEFDENYSPELALNNKNLAHNDSKQIKTEINNPAKSSFFKIFFVMIKEIIKNISISNKN